MFVVMGSGGRLRHSATREVSDDFAFSTTMSRFVAAAATFAIGYGNSPGTRRPETVMQPRSGVTVVDFTRYLPGPYCTVILADHGAEVIKIERPGTVDESRAHSALIDALVTGGTVEEHHATLEVGS